MKEPTLVTAVVGDAWLGKSSLYLTHCTKRFPKHHVTAAEVEDCELTITLGGVPHKMDWFEVSGDLYDFNAIRHFNYRRSRIILLCFSVVRPLSFANIRKRWAPEVKHHARKGSLVVLVGTQVDLRTDDKVLETLEAHKAEPVSFEQGRQLARKIKAVKYIECSAKTKVGLDDLFDEVNRLAQLLQKRADRGDMCSIS